MKQFWKICTVILTSTVFLTQTMPVLAADAENTPYGDITYIEKADGTLEITGLTEPYDATTALIPSEIDKKTVTSIGDYAFQYIGRNLTKITIPDTVTTIGDGAFFDCDEMVTFSLPNHLTTIGAFAFAGCNALKKLVIPNSVTSIGKSAFYHSALEEIQLSDSLTEIAPELFHNCDSLKTVSVPDGVTSIGDKAFAYMDALESVTLPEGLTTIGDGAFMSDTALSTLTIPSTVTEIGEKAFSSASALLEITIPEGVTSIRTSTFSECDNLKTVILPDSVTAIEECAFSWCDNLETVSVPANLKTIGENAFYPDGSLTSFWLPDGVTEIGKGAFHGCTSLTEFYIPTGITKLNSSTISNCWNMQKLTIGDTLKEISSYAMYGTNALTEISVSENNPYLMDSDGVVYDKEMTTLLKYPMGRTDDTYIVPNGVTTIASRGLISNVTNLYLPGSLTAIEESGVYSGNLKEVWYDGTETMWKENVVIEQSEESNVTLLQAEMHFKKEPIVNPVIPEQDYESGDPLPALSLSEGDTPGIITWAEDAPETLHGGANTLCWEFTPEDSTAYISTSGTLQIKAAFAEGEGIRGDVDGNGFIDTNDAYLVLLYYAKRSVGDNSYTLTGSIEADQTLLPLIDVNCDGQITPDDAYLILLYYAKTSVGIEDVQWENLL